MPGSLRPVVLVVDDDPDARDMLVEVLTDRGVRAVSAANVDEADILLSALRIDVVVTDYAMPGADGLSFLRALRRSTLRAMPVIMISAHDRSGDIAAEAREHGAVFLGKPLDLSRLVAVVETALASTVPVPELGPASSDRLLDIGRTPTPATPEMPTRPAPPPAVTAPAPAPVPTKPAPAATGPTGDPPPAGRVAFRLPRPPRLPKVREEIAEVTVRDPRRDPE